MATWIAHMRIAEHFMKSYPALDTTTFLVRNIGPDCGVPNVNWSSFTPNKNITHWQTDGNTINSDDFKQKYLDNQSLNPFYLGYYFHLLTDIEWIKLYNKKKLEPVYIKGFAEDSSFVWTAKKDWYGQDHLYLQENPTSVFYTNFIKIENFENNYFDFYPPNAFIRQIKHISQFYLNSNEDPEREFPYLSKYEMDSFVTNTIDMIDKTYKSNFIN